MQLSYADRVYIKQQYPAQKLQQGFLNTIKQYYDSQDSRTCLNNDDELYIYLSAMFHNTEVKGSNIKVLTQYTDLDNNNAYGDPTKLFQALFTNKAFLRWKQNSFDLNVDQTMMHIEDERFIWLQHDTETIFKIKQTNRQLEESEGNLIYVMCHTRPNYHWMDEWFEAEAEQLNMKNIEYKYVDAMPNDHFETHDIVADIFAGNKENALADIVYAPDCDGIWGKLFSRYNQDLFKEALQKLFQWVKDSGYLYVSKLSDEAIEHLKQIGFEAVTHTLEGYKVTMYRRQKKPETIIEAVGDNLMQKAIFNTGFGLPLTSDSLLINNKVQMLNNKAISIDKASKYFFVTTQFNESVKPFKIQINKKKYYLASAVVATATVDEYGEADETYSAGGHYVAVWVHKGLKKAFRLDSLDPDGTKASNTRELNTVDEIQEELKSAQILIYAREKYIDYDRYDKEIKLLQQTRYLCFLNAGLNALRYIKPFYEAISSNVQEVPRQQADVQSNLINSEQDNLEFAKGVYIKPNDTVTNNFLMDLYLKEVGVKAYIENALDNKADDTIVNNILRPEIQKIIKNKKIICHYNIDELLKIKDLKRHLIVKNSYLNQTVIEHYINVLKHGRHYKEFSVNAMDKNIIIFELVHVHNKGSLSDAMVRNHYDILKYYFHLIKFKTSSAFNDVINIPLEDEREYGVKCSNYILQNLKTIFKRRNTNEALLNKRRFVYDQIELKLDKLQSILIPVGDGREHFWLYHIWFEGNPKSIGHIDCYNKNYGTGQKYIEEHAEYIKKIEEWLRNKLPTIQTWQSKQLLDVQQGNAACGVYVCQLIREIVKAYPKKWNERVNVSSLQKKLYKKFTCTDNANKEYIEKCREYMCVELIENRILNYNKLK